MHNRKIIAIINLLAITERSAIHDKEKLLSADGTESTAAELNPATNSVYALVLWGGEDADRTLTLTIIDMA